MAKSAAAMNALAVVVCMLLASISSATAERKLLQPCPSNRQNPCYNAIGSAFTCCPASCGGPPGAVAFCDGESNPNLGSSPTPAPTPGPTTGAPAPSTGTPVPTASGTGIPVPPNALIQPATAQPLTKDTLDSGFLNGISHVLIISIDGMHERDLAYQLAIKPNSSGFGYLVNHGTRYTNALTSGPSDSYPGTLALIAGGGPATVGEFYDNSYNRLLSPPLSLGGDTSCSKVGTAVVFDETIDLDLTKIDGGGAINTSTLPRDPKNGCKPVYPYQYVKTNNIFEIAVAAGKYTGFTDKSTGGYEVARGPSGTGVSDYASLEIKTTEPQYLDATGNSDGFVGTGYPPYDAQKVQEVLNWAKGYTHDGKTFNGFAPALMYMNFQVVSVNQKLAGQGYVNDADPPAGPVPTPYVQASFDFVDKSLAAIVAQLEQSKILGNTLFVVTAKHGQSPIDPTLLTKIKPGVVTDAIAKFLNSPAEPAHFIGDDVAIIWLYNTAAGPALRDYLNANKAMFGIDHCDTYADLGYSFDDRVPDIICVTVKGLIYTGGSKIAEHGGFSDDDRHVPLIVANKYLTARTYTGPVETKQVAPTALAALGLPLDQLQAAQIDGTAPLPDAQIY